VYALFALAIAAAGTVALNRCAAMDVVFSWLVAANAVTVLVYGLDKAIAGSRLRRVPERVLLMLALVGGSPGAFVGMQVFRHKTSKESFRLRFWIVVALQVALVAAYCIWLRPPT
jgi:uncharacterized membrane protein YsdA (DUF1294 family)